MSEFDPSDQNRPTDLGRSLEEMRECGRVDHLIDRCARFNPSRIAAVDGDRSYSFRELNALINSLAASLTTLGLEQGQTVAFLIEHSVEALVAFLAIQRAGFVMVPLNSKLTTHELETQITHSRAVAVVTRSTMLSQLEWLSVTPGTVSYVVRIDGAGELAIDEPAFLGKAAVVSVTLDGDCEAVITSTRTETDAAALWYTSGTTGEPKGVLHSHRSGVDAVTSWIEALELGPDDRGIALNFYHIAAMSSPIPILAAGGTIVIVPQFKVEGILELIEKFGLTYVLVLPIFLNLIDRTPEIIKKFDLSSIRIMLYGSAPLDPEVARRSVARFPGASWAHAWSQTELNSGGTVNLGETFLTRFGSIGLPIPCIKEIGIFSDAGVKVAPREVGELCVKSQTMMLGYYHDAGRTNETLRDGWLHTGDLAYIDEDGYLFLRGRQREVIIRGGENIYPVEVEAVLGQHSEVAEASVVGLRDSVMTEVPVAFVILREGATTDAESLLEFARERLARFKVPVFIDLVEEFPRNSNGKVQKMRLAESVSSRAR